MNAWTRRGLLCLALGGAGLVWQPGAALAQRGPCADDIGKLCKDVQPGGGAILKCLSEHEAELAPACKAHVDAMRVQGRGFGKGKGPGSGMRRQGPMFAQACKGDVQKFCTDVQPGGGRVINCLKEHAAELSPGCKAATGQ